MVSSWETLRIEQLQPKTCNHHFVTVHWECQEKWNANTGTFEHLVLRPVTAATWDCWGKILKISPSVYVVEPSDSPEKVLQRKASANTSARCRHQIVVPQVVAIPQMLVPAQVSRPLPFSGPNLLWEATMGTRLEMYCSLGWQSQFIWGVHVSWATLLESTSVKC